MRELYELDQPSTDDLDRITQQWTRFRSWANLLICLNAETSTTKEK